MPTPPTSAEHTRLADSEARKADWKNWGPYLSERAWGTVREDYSVDGNAWAYFPHDHARSRAYRWNEDGLGGFSNRFQNICMAVALWNEQDPFLKERLFGLANTEGNHGEDVKEIYFYLDAVPSHAYMKMLYRYPQVAFPYDDLVKTNGQRGRDEDEYEVYDSLREVLEARRFFDVFIEYAKADEEDILSRITVVNRSDAPAPIHLLPHLWFRNTWSWGYDDIRPQLSAAKGDANPLEVDERHLGERCWYVEAILDGSPVPFDWLFTDNDTNVARLFDAPNPSPYVKDGIGERVVNQQKNCVNPKRKGTKAAAWFQAVLPPGGTLEVRTRFTPKQMQRPFQGYNRVFQQRIEETDAFYAAIQPSRMSEDEKRVQRQAFAGILWSKQFYHYSVELWLQGDPGQPPAERDHPRNENWGHMYALDVMSMPDKWEYPWFAAWDLAFHAVPLAMIDPEWAKRQLILTLREWYMHPNGQLPAYEWSFSDVNPPVHAWAALQVYRFEQQMTGRADTDFLERIFQKLLLNFTWWVNRKDREGNNVFQGGFLGMDNISIFDRNTQLPDGAHIEQADGTAWMALFSLNMLTIAVELAQTKPAYEDMATKFFEHFIYIANAFYDIGGGHGLWDEEDGFFYDMLHVGEDQFTPLKIRSFVGLLPLIAVETFERKALDNMPRFQRRLDWFLKYRQSLLQRLECPGKHGEEERQHMAVMTIEQLATMLKVLFDETEFLSDHGLRSLSRYHAQHPFKLKVGDKDEMLHYVPGNADTETFGGNSNWRGPIWMPINYLVIGALRTFHRYYGESFKVECPTGSGNQLTLNEAADELSARLIRLFVADETGRRTFWGKHNLEDDPLWRDYLLFNEYFHGDTGVGLGASHQTGWTALVACLLQERG